MPSPAKAHCATVDSRPLPATDKDKTDMQCRVASTNVPLRHLDKEITVDDLIADSDSDTEVRSRPQPRSEAKSKSDHTKSKPRSKSNTRNKTTKAAENATSTSAAPTTATTNTETKTDSVSSQTVVDGGPHKHHKGLKGNGPLSRVLDKVRPYQTHGPSGHMHTQTCHRTREGSLCNTQSGSEPFRHCQADQVVANARPDRQDRLACGDLEEHGPWEF